MSTSPGHACTVPMLRQTVSVHTEEIGCTFKIDEFRLVFDSCCMENGPRVSKALKDNSVSSDVILKTGLHAFSLVVAWSLGAKKEVMPHSMLGLAIRRLSGEPGNAVKADLALVNRDPLRTARKSHRGTIALQNSIGWYPCPHATAREDSDGFVPLRDVLDPSKGWLENGSLTVECKMKLATSRPKTVQRSRAPMNTLQNLSLQLGALFSSGRHTDVALIVGQERIDAHSLILGARSPVFDAMWSHSMAERESKTVTISDLEPAAVRRMVTYMYRGELDRELDNDSDTTSLLQAAHRYQVIDLVELCVEALSSTITTELAAERLMLADMLDIDVLKHECLGYITKSPDVTVAVQGTASFKQLTMKRPHLTAEILAAAFPPSKAARVK